MIKWALFRLTQTAFAEQHPNPQNLPDPAYHDPVGDENSHIADAPIHTHLRIMDIQVENPYFGQRPLSQASSTSSSGAAAGLTGIDKTALPHSCSVIAATLRVDAP